MSVPSAPIVLDTPDARKEEIQFYWAPPTSGSPITNYTIFSDSPAITCNTGPITDLTYTINNLTNGSNYSFAITADNSNGTSPSTIFNTVTPGNAPSNPLNLSYTFNNDSNVTINWSTPTTDGGAPIYRYGVWVFPLDASNSPLSNLAVKKYTYANVFSRNIDLPFSAGTSNYKYTVRAINDTDWSGDIPSAYSTLTFLPTSITEVENKIFWYDGDDPNGNGIRPSNGANITTWVNKVGSNNAIGSGASYATGTPGYINLSNDKYAIQDPSPIFNKYWTIFTVENAANTGRNKIIIGQDNFARNEMRIGYFNDTTYSFTINNNFWEPAGVRGSGTRVTSFMLSAEGRKIYGNGVIVGSNSYNTQVTTWVQPLIGFIENQFYYYTGQMKEIVVVTGDLNSNADLRARIEQILATKWGVTLG
jgi:hypothetical protein